MCSLFSVHILTPCFTNPLHSAFYNMPYTQGRFERLHTSQIENDMNYISLCFFNHLKYASSTHLNRRDENWVVEFEVNLFSKLLNWIQYTV